LVDLCHTLLLQAIQKGNMEGAKIHAENSIRQKNQALNYRRMSARIDAVAARVQTAITTKQVSLTRVMISEDPAACKNRVMRCCCGYLSGARYRLFASGPGNAAAAACQKPIISCLILIQSDFTFLVPAYPGCGKGAVKQV